MAKYLSPLGDTAAGPPDFRIPFGAVSPPQALALGLRFGSWSLFSTATDFKRRRDVTGGSPLRILGDCLG
jgi:hypothetical protein